MSFSRYLSKLASLLNSSGQVQTSAIADANITPAKLSAGAPTWDSSGKLLPANGIDLGTVGQIKFPATQNPSSDANTLDDYEEGTWTPTISSSGTSPTVSAYEARNGTYTKVGNLVTANCYIRANISNAGTGTPSITGLPFAASADSGITSAALSLANLFTVRPDIYMPNGYSLVYGSGAAWSTSANNYVCFTVSYRTNT